MTGLVVHEWIARAGGSENVVEQFLELHPDADLQVLWNDDAERFGGQVHETWLARTPLRRSKAAALPFIPLTWRTVPARKDYDWLLVSSHLFAHHVSPRNLAADVPKYTYVHTPARYIWEPDLDTRGASPLARGVSTILKPLDRRRAQESTALAANSHFTKARIESAWGREASVIYPPVDTETISSVTDWSSRLSSAEQDVLESLPDTFLLGASRFVSYKRLDEVIRGAALADVPVVIAGRGPEEAALRELAAQQRVPVHFVLSPSDAMLYALYERCLAFVFLAIEDFGIMPIEAMAAGAPTIVTDVGGAAESAGVTGAGAILRGSDRAAWLEALASANGRSPEAQKDAAKAFSRARFRTEIEKWMHRG